MGDMLERLSGEWGMARAIESEGVEAATDPADILAVFIERVDLGGGGLWCYLMCIIVVAL